MDAATRFAVGRRARHRSSKLQDGQHNDKQTRTAMTEQEIDNMLWRAFLLGARVVADQNGADVSAHDIGKLSVVVRQIAESDATLADPTALSARHSEIGSLMMRLGTLTVRNDRDLAGRIFRGFAIATQTDW